MSHRDAVTPGIRPWEIHGPATFDVDLTWAVRAALASGAPVAERPVPGTTASRTKAAGATTATLRRVETSA